MKYISTIINQIYNHIKKRLIRIFGDLIKLGVFSKKNKKKTKLAKVTLIFKSGKNELLLNSIKVRIFFVKHIKYKYLRRLDKNCYFYCKSKITVINLIVGSRNMIKISKKHEFVKN